MERNCGYHEFLDRRGALRVPQDMAFDIIKEFLGPPPFQTPSPPPASSQSRANLFN